MLYFGCKHQDFHFQRLSKTRFNMQCYTVVLMKYKNVMTVINTSGLTERMEQRWSLKKEKQECNDR